MKIGIVGAPSFKMEELRASLEAKGIEVEIIPPCATIPDQVIGEENVCYLKTAVPFPYKAPPRELKCKNQTWRRKGKNSRF